MSKKIVKSEFEPHVQTPKTVLFLITSLLERQEKVSERCGCAGEDEWVVVVLEISGKF